MVLGVRPLPPPPNSLHVADTRLPFPHAPPIVPIFCIVGQREREDKGEGYNHTKNGGNVETCDYVRGGVCGPFKKAESKLLCMTRGVRRRVSEQGFYVVEGGGSTLFNFPGGGRRGGGGGEGEDKRDGGKQRENNVSYPWDLV